MDKEQQELVEELRLTPEQVGDCLDLEVEATYPCSNGGRTSTVSVDTLLQAQIIAVLTNRRVCWMKEDSEVREKVAQETRTLLFGYNVGTDYIQVVSDKFTDQILSLISDSCQPFEVKE